MHERNYSAAVIALLLAGCGGGSGSDETAVSANPPAPPPVAGTPTPPPPPPVAATPTPGAPAPGAPTPPAPAPAAPAPAPGVPTPAPAAPTPPTPAPATPTPSPAPIGAPSVSGPLVWAALQTGVSPDPAPNSPYTNYRQVRSGSSYFHLGGALESYVVSGGFPNASGIGLSEVVSVAPIANSGVINAVKANGLTLEGPQLDLRNINPEIDAAAGTWTSGAWSASLIIQSDASGPDRMRVCWNAHLPPPPPVTGPPGFTPVVRTAPFKRLMCGVYSSQQAGPDVGGYLIDDFDGTVRTFSAAW